MSNITERPESGQQATRPGARRRAPLIDVNALPPVIAPYAETWSDLDRAKVDLIKRTICPEDTTDDELALFLHECKRRGVHPLDGAVVMTKRNDNRRGEKRIVFMTTIHYKRSRAEDTGAYAGNDDIEYGPPLRAERSNTEPPPSWAKATVYKIVGGIRCPFTAKVWWKEYYPGSGPNSFMWDRMPNNQLGKCAESKALEKAFPQKLGNLPIAEELDRPDHDPVDPQPIASPPRAALPPSAPAAPRRTSVFIAAPVAPAEEEAEDDAPDPNVEEAWTVVSLEAGNAAATTKDFRRGAVVWSLTAANAVGGTVVALTADARLASTLQELQEQQREFAMEWAERGTGDDGYDLLTTVTPL